MDHGIEPDPARGVFSTMLVVEGRPVELDPHLAQLRESVRTLYGVALPERAAELIATEARGFELGRVRLACRLDPDGALRLEAQASAVERALVLPDDALALRTAPVEGWCGAHKWVDRRLLERLDAAAAPAAALLVQDGRVLETTRANVFALGEDAVLRTPPADGSILPGATRAAAIALAHGFGVEVREEPLTPADVRAAREVFATGSIRGVEPVRSLDGAGVGGHGELTGAIADALRRRWLAKSAVEV
jgi:para-aminobenzoate synthetase / 4-amino-4-deoxychorismate lyase